MSEDVFVHAFENGEPQPISTTKVLSCFEGYIQKKEKNYIEVVFGPADSSTIYLKCNESTIDNLMIERPCGDPRLSECIYQVMQLGNFVLFIPGVETPLVVSSKTIAHIPQDTLESLGDPKVTPQLGDFIQAFLKP